MRALPALVVLVAFGTAGVASARRCEDGRFVVDHPLLPVELTPFDAVVFARPRLSLDSGCPAKRARIQKVGKKTKLQVKWPVCTDVEGAVRLRATIERTCDTMTGRVIARGADYDTTFTATRTRCGDGIVDTAADEECDTGTTCAVGAECTDCHCIPTTPVLAGPGRGSAVAVTPDDTRAVVVNRDAGSVTVLALAFPQGTPATATVVREVDVGAGTEPWQVAIAPDGRTAYVILRRDQKVVRIADLTTDTPAVTGEAAVGSEPTGIALAPTGATAWVTNWADGTLSEIDTAAMTVRATIDLNAALAATGALGVTTSRPALAHPRALAVTNDGDSDDSDERVLVTEFFAQQAAEELGNGSNADVFKNGLVYVVGAASRAVSTIWLGALADMGFRDQNNAPTGCYPNQLGALAVNGNFAFVVSVCASPEGPIGPRVTATACTSVTDCAALVDPVCVQTAAGSGTVCVDRASVKTTSAPVVSVIDLGANQEVAAAQASLNARFRDFFDTAGTADNASRRFPLAASDIAFVPGTSVAYVTANGTDAVFRVVYDAATGAITSVGAAQAGLINLNPTGIAAGGAGQGPVGLAITGGGSFALVANDLSRNATLVDLRTQAISGGTATPSVVATTARPSPGTAAEQAFRGKRFFYTGLGRWSLGGQGWGACQTCHPDGLTDNVTWYFARGPRQSTSLDGSFDSADASNQRVFNWTGIFDEVADFEANTRGISGGVGAIVLAASSPPANGDRIDLANAEGQNHNGLNGSAAALADPANPLGLGSPSILNDWDDITTFMQRIRSPRGATGLDAAAVARGRTLFTADGNCQGCHGGAKWTVSERFYTPSVATNTALQTTSWSAPATGAGFPASLFPAVTVANQVMRFGNAVNDQILCAVRPVGTFNVAEPGVGIAELRADMATAAQGNGDASGDGRGYNPPSLLGLATGGPYLHAGNARTLEAFFAAGFAAHHQALATNFLTDIDPAQRAAKVADLAAFLLSIDEDTTAVAIPSLGPQGGSLCAAP